jgi:hypothetical protein
MFPDSSGQPREADQKLESYQGVLLDLFTGGGH